MKSTANFVGRYGIARRWVALRRIPRAWIAWRRVSWVAWRRLSSGLLTRRWILALRFARLGVLRRQRLWIVLGHGATLRQTNPPSACPAYPAFDLNHLRCECQPPPRFHVFLHTARDRLRSPFLETRALQARFLRSIGDEPRLDEDLRHPRTEQHVEQGLLHPVVADRSHPAAQRPHQRRLHRLRQIARVARVRLGGEVRQDEPEIAHGPIGFRIFERRQPRRVPGAGDVPRPGPDPLHLRPPGRGGG